MDHPVLRKVKGYFVGLEIPNGKILRLELKQGKKNRAARDAIMEVLNQQENVPASITNEAIPSVTMDGMGIFPFRLEGFTAGVKAARGKVQELTDECLDRFLEAANECTTQLQYVHLRARTVMWIHPAMNPANKPRELQSFNKYALWNLLTPAQETRMLEFKAEVLSKLP